MTLSRPDIRSEEVFMEAFNTQSLGLHQTTRESGAVTVGNQNINAAITTYFSFRMILDKNWSKKCLPVTICCQKLDSEHPLLTNSGY